MLNMTPFKTKWYKNWMELYKNHPYGKYCAARTIQRAWRAHFLKKTMKQRRLTTNIKRYLTKLRLAEDMPVIMEDAGWHVWQFIETSPYEGLE